MGFNKDDDAATRATAASADATYTQSSSSSSDSLCLREDEGELITAQLPMLLLLLCYANWEVEKEWGKKRRTRTTGDSSLFHLKHTMEAAAVLLLNSCISNSIVAAPNCRLLLADAIAAAAAAECYPSAPIEVLLHFSGPTVPVAAFWRWHFCHFCCCHCS